MEPTIESFLEYGNASLRQRAALLYTLLPRNCNSVSLQHYMLDRWQESHIRAMLREDTVMRDIVRFTLARCDVSTKHYGRYPNDEVVAPPIIAPKDVTTIHRVRLDNTFSALLTQAGNVISTIRPMILRKVPIENTEEPCDICAKVRSYGISPAVLLASIYVAPRYKLDPYATALHIAMMTPSVRAHMPPIYHAIYSVYVERLCVEEISELVSIITYDIYLENSIIDAYRLASAAYIQRNI